MLVGQPREPFGPEPFTEMELAGAKLLRARLTCEVPGRPPVCEQLLTEFSLARVWRLSGANCAEAEQRVRELNDHMHAFDYRLEQSALKCVQLDFAKRTFERFPISRVDDDVFSGDTLVFLERMEGCDIKQILRVVPLGHILQAYTLLQLNFMRAVLERERITGRQCGVVCVIDLQGLPLRDFVNPLSAPSRMARLIVHIWSKYFSENLIRIYLVHPPGLLSLMWQVTRHILDERTQSRIVFLHKASELAEHLAKEALPEAYGGTRRDDTGFCALPSTCVSAPVAVAASEHFCAEQWWRHTTGQHQMSDWESVQLRGGGPKAVHESEKIWCEPGDRFIWLYTSSRDFHFEVVCKKDAQAQHELPVWPKQFVSSVSIAEHGCVECRQAGNYVARFTAAGGGTGFMGFGGGAHTKIGYMVRGEQQQQGPKQQ